MPQVGERTVDASYYEIKAARLAWDISRAYALILLALAAAALRPELWVILPAIVLIGAQQYALQIVLHDGLHSHLMSTKRGSDRVARVFLCYPIFNPLAGFRRKHMDHHRRLGTPDDPDRYYHATEGKSTRLGFILFLLGLKSAPTTLLSGLRSGRDRTRRPASAKEMEQRRREARFDYAALFVVQAIIAASMTLWIGAWAYPVLWVLPWYLGVFVAQNLRSFAEHAQPEPDALADSHRNITFRAPWIEQQLFAPNNMMYHAEHHLYPQVPYYHLPRLRAALESRGEMRAVEYRDSYLGFAWRYWRSLPIADAAASAVPPRTTNAA